MKDADTLLKVLSARPIPLLAGAGMLLLAMLGLDVPQGLPDREIIASWPVATGRYVVAFGLHHLARSPFLWGTLLLAGLHLAARRVRRPEDRPRIGAVEAVGIVLVLAALGTSATVSHAPEQPDRTRLRVRMTAPDGRDAAQVVEEGSAYRLPTPRGDRTLLFGSAAMGPYAVESRPDGTLRVHLPSTGVQGTTSDLRVFARRPPAQAVPEGHSGAPWVVVATTLLLVGAGIGVLAAAVRRLPTAPAGSRLVVTTGAIVVALVTLVNPWSGPGTGWFPVGAGSGGGPVLHRMMVQGTADVAPWTAVLPARASLGAFQVVARLAGLLAVVSVVLLGLSGWTRQRRGRISNGLVMASGIAFALGGVVLLAHGLLRIPLAISPDDLGRSFAADLLPRLPASLSVLSATMNHGGPYTLTWWAGLIPGLGLVAFGSVLLFPGRPPRSNSTGTPSLMGPLLAVIIAALLRASAAFWFPGSAAAPAASASVALVAASLAALALLADGRHPGDARNATLLAIAASALPFVLLP